MLYYSNATARVAFPALGLVWWAPVLLPYARRAPTFLVTSNKQQATSNEQQVVNNEQTA